MKPIILSSAEWESVFIRENLSGTETVKAEGIKVHTGRLSGLPMTLVELEKGSVSGIDVNLLARLNPEYLVSIGEAYSCKKNLNAGDVVISSAAVYLDSRKATRLAEVGAELRLVDLGLKVAEELACNGQICKFVVGRVLLNPGNASPGRKLNFIPRNDIYCIDSNGFPLTQWAVESQIPFVLVRTIIPVPGKNRPPEVAQIRRDTAKKNFWLVKGILEGLKKMQTPGTGGKVDLI